MKKFFTLIAAVALAASVNAQTFKSFEKTTVFITNKENVAAGITEGCMPWAWTTASSMWMVRKCRFWTVAPASL